MSTLVNITSLRWLMNIDNIEKYLYEIIDDYKNSNSDKEKNDIFKSFCSSIWSCENKRRVYDKIIKYSVKKDLLNTDVGKIFDMWSEIEYKGYKAMSRETDWRSLIRQKINNLYTRYFDKNVILKQDYMDLLNTPKRLYYQWIEGMDINPDKLTIIIDNAIDDAEKLKIKYQQQKMDLSWNEYKKIIEGFLQKCFNNCKLIEDFESKSNLNIYDFINEDNLYISYFCKNLEGYMMNYVKEYYGLKRGRNKKYKRCIDCNNLFELHTYNQQRCPICQTLFTRKNKTEKQRKYRVEKLKK